MRVVRKLAAGGALGGLVCGYFLFRELPLPSASGPPYQRLEQKAYDQHPNRHFITKVPVTIGVVGGGSTGLATAKVLKQQGFQVEVLEKGTDVGGVWADNYQDAGLQGPLPHYNIPDFPFPEGTPLFPKLPEVHAYLNNYAETFSLKSLIRFNSEVVKADQNSDGVWTVTLKNGTKKQYDFLVLSTGQFYRPFTPDIPGLESFPGRVLHSFHVRNAKELFTGKKVVVVGGGKSAYDMLGLASANNCQVTSVMLERVWLMPVTEVFGGRSVMEWVTCRLAGLFNPRPYEMDHWGNQLLRPIGKIYFDLLCNHLKADMPDHIQPTIDVRRQGLIARDPELFKKLADRQIEIVQGRIEKVTSEGVVVKGRLIPADVIVFATGFKQTTLGLGDDTDTFWLYRGVIDPKLRNCAILGYGNMAFSLLKSSLQAAWLCDVLRGTVVLPSIETMKRETEDLKSATIKVFGDKAPCKAYAWNEFKYYDKLLSDMHLQTRRKPTLYQDLVSMPDPLDYKLVLTHRV